MTDNLATLYGVEIKRFNEQVKRNIKRFPEDFMFQLTKDECLRSQIATLNEGRGQYMVKHTLQSTRLMIVKHLHGIALG